MEKGREEPSRLTRKLLSGWKEGSRDRHYSKLFLALRPTPTDEQKDVLAKVILGIGK